MTVNTLRVKKIMSYIIAILEPLGPREPRIPVDNFAENYIGPCTDIAHGVISIVEDDLDGALRRFDKLAASLDRAVAYCRGDDLDAVTARHLRPLINKSWEMAERLAGGPTIISDRVRDSVQSEYLGVSTHPYFELHLCRALLGQARRVFDTSGTERNDM